ncbi:unnamed protein product, partial [Medioppia subpectinata]
MILLLLFIIPIVCSAKSSQNDLISLETAYQRPQYEPPTGYYSSPGAVPYAGYEEPQLEYISHPYPAHETPKSEYISNYYKSAPKRMPSYPPPEYSPANAYPPPASIYGYSAPPPPPPKPYDSYKPQKYSYQMPLYPREYMKYKPNKKHYKPTHPMPPNPHPSIMYPIDDYYEYKKPQPYSHPPPPPPSPPMSKHAYVYPYKPEPQYQPQYNSYSTTKAYPPMTYSDHPKHSYSP